MQSANQDVSSAVAAAISRIEGHVVGLAAVVRDITTLFNTTTRQAFSDGGRQRVDGLVAAGVSDDLLLGHVVGRLKAEGLQDLFRVSIAAAPPIDAETWERLVQRIRQSADKE